MEDRLRPMLSHLEELEQYQMYLTEMLAHVNPHLQKALKKEIELVEIQIRQMLSNDPGVGNQSGELS